VHDVQVRAKRWFKIRNQHTNAQGEFSIGTRYVNPVQISVIFRNGELSVKPLRNRVGVRISLLPVQARLGTYAHCELNTIEKIFYRTASGQQGEPLFATSNGDNRFTRTFLHWMAATAVVTRKYQIAQGNLDKVKPMEARSLGGHRLQLYLATGGTPSARGAYAEMPMLAYMNKGFTWADAYDIGKLILYSAKTYLAIQSGLGVQAGVYANNAKQALLSLVLQGSLPDAILYYNTPNLNLSSSEVSQKFAEIYTIAGLLKDRPNNEDWKAYLKKNDKIMSGILSGYSFYEAAKKLPLISILLKYQDKWFQPTMDLASIGASFLSLYQSVSAMITASDKELFDMYGGFAEAYSHFITGRKYGVFSDDILDQNFNEVKSNVTTSSNLIFMETWRSAGVTDKLSTIYMSGLFYDLFDSQNDDINGNSNRNEMVQGISWENIAKAGLGKSGFIPSPDEFWEWRTNLSQTNAAQATQINSLFNWYLSP
jgi:hypothetical protein